MSDRVFADKFKAMFPNSSETTVLPDGSGFFTASIPLPKDHWLHEEGGDYPPMPFQKGTDDPERKEWARKITWAARYAIRASTMNGKDNDFDPDAMCQNMVVGMLGYWTPTGAASEELYDKTAREPE